MNANLATRPEARQHEQTVRLRRNTMSLITVAGVVSTRGARFEWNTRRSRMGRRTGN